MRERFNPPSMSKREVKIDPFQKQKDAFKEAHPDKDPVKDEPAYIHWLMTHPQEKFYAHELAKVSNQQSNTASLSELTVVPEQRPSNVVDLHQQEATAPLPAVKAVASGE